MNNLLQVWAKWTVRQRIALGLGAVLTLVVVGALLKTFGTPEYKPLMVGMQPEDVQSISAQLAAKKIAFELSPDGKGINVAADQLDAARLQIASDGSPHSGRMGFELFDKSSWGQTEFDEKVNYQRALEGELERTIATLSDVKSARVHIVMPTASVFLDQERPAKASVALRMKRGSLTADQLHAVARLVSGAVDGLAAHDVTIIDADSNESLSNKPGSIEGRELEAELTRRLLATLAPAVGIDNLRASVNVEYDLSSSEESQDKYDPAVSAVLASQKSQEQIGGGTTVGGVAGTASNLPNTGSTTPPPTPGGENAQSTSTENATFGVNKLIRRTISPAGSIRRISAAILVNDSFDRKQIKGQWITTPHKRAQAQLDQLAELARGVLGADKARGDVITIQNMTFDVESTLDPTPTIADKVKSRLNDFATPLRYAAMLLLLVLVWALMVRPVQKQILASLKELPPAGPVNALAQAAQVLAVSAPAHLIESDPEAAHLKRELNELVLAEPASMTRTLQSWLRETKG